MGGVFSIGSMKRLVTAVLLMVVLGVVLASRFAGFEVKPSGNADFDVSTGVYTLPTGGTITDNQNKLVLEAKYIQYKERDFIRAKEAKLVSGSGNFVAATLEYLTQSDTLKLGNLQFGSKDIKAVSASQGLLLKEDILILKGEVRSKNPQLEANVLVVDIAKDQALVQGAFAYSDGPTSLRAQRPDAALLLTFTQGKVRASTKVPAEVAGRLGGLASKLP
jgi:hypothetical protein